MFDTKRLKFGHKYGETPPNLFSDFAWVRHNQQQLLEQYGECSIVVYQEQVIGVGESVEASLADAESNLPPEIGEITPIQTWLIRPLISLPVLEPQAL